MAEIKRGILTAIKHNLEVMPRVINKFDDAKMGKKADSLVFHKDRPETREEAMITIIEATVANNRIGQLSDYVPMIYARIHAFGRDELANLSLDELVQLTKDIRKADAQVNLSIDFAKKFPDIVVKWLETELNCLESEQHKHAGKAKGFADDGNQVFYPELPVKEGMRDGGIVSGIHDILADIPETKNLKSVGISKHGHNIWEEENVVKYDTSKMDVALWHYDGTDENGLKDKEQLIYRLSQAQKSIENEKLARRISKEIERLDKELYKDVSADTVLFRLEDIARIAIEEGYTAQQAYHLVGLIFEGNETTADNAWKKVSNIRLNWLKKHMNNVHQEEDTSLAATIRPIQQTIRLWAKSWAMAKAENTKVENATTEEEAEVLAKNPVYSEDECTPIDEL